MMIEHISAATDVARAATGFNPFDGVTPSWGPFGPLFKSKVGVFLGLAWAIAFVYVAYHLVEASARMAKARKGFGDDLAETKRDLGLAAAATVLLASLPLLFSVLAG